MAPDSFVQPTLADADTKFVTDNDLVTVSENCPGFLGRLAS